MNMHACIITVCLDEAPSGELKVCVWVLHAVVHPLSVRISVCVESCTRQQTQSHKQWSPEHCSSRIL